MRRLQHWVFGFLGLVFASRGVCDPAEGASFQEVWNAVSSDPYDKPYNRVSVSQFFRLGTNRLLEAAQRTVRSDADILPRFDKLLHANGICLKGEWKIDKSSRYSGYFKQGARGLFVGRASVALSDTEKGKYRSFGLAGKLFPTLNQNQRVKTANFFVIEDLGGTMTPHYLDAPMINEPPVSLNVSSIFVAPIAAATAANFGKADSNPGVRQVYPISELGLRDPSSAITPRWMRIQGVEGGVRVDELDFRDELQVTEYPNRSYRFNIDVAAPTSGKKNWETIGKIEIKESVISDSCDHRLHFTHHKFRNDINY